MEKCAVIDIGSNSIRLVVYELLETMYIKEVEDCKVTAKLDNYLSEGNVLSETGIEQLIHILNSFKEILGEYHVKKISVMATATIRKAYNQATIIERVKRETGFLIRILSGKEEAAYGLTGIFHSTVASTGFSIDIGGGSTEITYFENREMVHYESFPFGVLTLKKQFVKDNVPSIYELEQLQVFLEEKFRDVMWLAKPGKQVFAIGGSARNVGKLYQHMTNYPLNNTHLFAIHPEGIKHVGDFLHPLSYEEIQKIEPLSKERADTIQIAMQVFFQFLKVTSASEFVICDKGIREGMYYKNFAFYSLPSSLKHEAVKSFIHYHDDNLEKKKQIANLSKQLFYALTRKMKVCKSDLSHDFLEWGAYLFGYGEKYSISNDQYTFYLMLNLDMDGFTHKEKLILALIASFKSKSRTKQLLKGFEGWLSKEEVSDVLLYGAIIKIANALCVAKHSNITQIQVSYKEKEVVLYFYCMRNSLVEEQRVQKQIKHLEKALKKDMNLCFLVGDRI